MALWDGPVEAVRALCRVCGKASWEAELSLELWEGRAQKFRHER